MKLNVCYSETVYYDDEVTFTDEQIKEMLDEVGIPENEREELFSDLDKLFDAVRDSQIFHDYLSESLTFKTADTDDFQYEYIKLIREEGE
jgi:predicted HAD superfamily phosphohydrolase